MSAVPRLFLFSSLAAIAAVAAHAGVPPASGWSIHPALAARVGYDDNVFLQNHAAILPGVTGAVPDHAGSWVARASVALEATWRLSPAFQFDASYSPESVRYEAFPSENHDNHRVDLGVRGRAGAWSHQFKASLLLVDGSENSPVFGHAGGGPAIGGVAVRSRRDQVNTKLGGHLTRALDGGFIRAVGDACVNDFQTRQLTTAIVPGYANYVDRSEWSAGVEAGRYVRKGFALVAGVRGGEQRQTDLLGVPPNYSNTLTRFLAGVEGKPRGDLTLRILGGPDLRRYGNAVAPGFDRSRTARYIEASATWTPRAADTVTFTGKDYLWLSAGGRCAYQHTSGNVQWKHTFTREWSAAFTADVQAGDSRDYGTSPGSRLDWIYTGTLNITRSLGTNTKLDLELTREWSDSAIAGTPGREYTHWLVSAGIRRTF
ncbi:MAG: hypothetical protein K0R17_2215 [Rariglobus sp.]|jgi:hypothetical protein|nr:hypothetical protein [Rariglobus sp.]